MNKQMNAHEIEATSQVVARSLLKHAREVYRYAAKFCAPSDANDRLTDDAKVTFAENLKRMVTDMHRLMGLARDRGVDRYCNVEQIDAYLESAHDLVREHCSVIEIPAMMN